MGSIAMRTGLSQTPTRATNRFQTALIILFTQILIMARLT